MKFTLTTFWQVLKGMVQLARSSRPEVATEVAPCEVSAVAHISLA